MREVEEEIREKLSLLIEVIGLVEKGIKEGIEEIVNIKIWENRMKNEMDGIVMKILGGEDIVVVGDVKKLRN